ncbi:DUF4232 domain-containing protein [Streptomyces sp. URMC 126]|uniref:DUF4232 domain-containing protein n=1 Tax=Streptomyces sp. URMC 126 TaxID=3423401 RepID=UPI003F1BD1BF
MRVQKLTFAALAIAASLSLTACQNDNDDDGKGKSAPASSSAASSSSSGDSQQGKADQVGADQGGSGKAGSEKSGGKDSEAGKGSDGKGPAGQGAGGQGTATGTGSRDGGGSAKCRTADLQITAKDDTIDGDPARTVVVQLKNRSGHSCTISGYAGVDLKTSAGNLSAKRSGQAGASSTLKPGQSTAFGITYPANDSGGSGVRVTGLLVTPPSETHTVSLPWPGAATLPVTDGSGSPVKVGPIGSAGQGG